MKKILLLILPLLIFSCSNEINELTQTPEKEFEVYNFEYNKEKYSVKYYFAADSTVVFEDPSMKELIEKIDNEPELATYVDSDGSISYFTDYATLVEMMGNNSVQTRSDYINFKIELYDGEIYTGKKLTIDNVPPIIVIPWYYDLSSVNFDNITSSAKIFVYNGSGTVQVTFYQKINCSGKTLTFKVAPPTDHLIVYSHLWIPKLSAYTMKSGFIGIGKKSWNNQISSVSIGKYYPPL